MWKTWLSGKRQEDGPDSRQMSLVRGVRMRGIIIVSIIALLSVAFALDAKNGASTVAAASPDGRSIYVANCSGCHGGAGEGFVRLAPSLAKNPYSPVIRRKSFKRC